jgi:membrane-bound metal-dependent hydrolase YbcI (DUF457 family)
MAYAVTHIILAIVLLDLVRHYLLSKKNFPRYLLVIGGIAGLAPDIDIPIGWIISLFTGTAVNLHGTFTHSIVFPIIFLLTAALLHYEKNMKWASIFYVIAFGWFFHLSLDCMYGGYKEFLWPLVINNFCPQWGLNEHASSIDAIILVAWLVHEELHKKIKDYI